MKNIHILPTEDKGRITKHNKELHIEKIAIYNEPSIKMEVFNMYITSDEEIKEGDWYCSPYGIISKHNGTEMLPDDWRKIILTTDQDLIKDGVQAINDEFLEWFVENPSCEFVEVEHFGTCCGNPLVSQCIDCKKYNPAYKIIIPDLWGEIFDWLEQEEPKRETLEEAKQRILDSNYLSLNDADIFEMGAEWQRKQILQFLYSEITERRPYSSSKMCEKVIEFIEQFKKK